MAESRGRREWVLRAHDSRLRVARLAHWREAAVWRHAPLRDIEHPRNSKSHDKLDSPAWPVVIIPCPAGRLGRKKPCPSQRGFNYLGKAAYQVPAAEAFLATRKSESAEAVLERRPDCQIGHQHRACPEQPLPRFVF